MPKILAASLVALVLCLPVFGKEKHQQASPVRPDGSGAKWAEKTLRKLSVEEKIGQLFMIWCRASFLNVDSPEYLQLREALEKYLETAHC